MSDMTLELHGASSLLQDLIVINGNMLRHDQRQLAGQLRVDLRIFKRLEKRLIEIGGFYIDPNGGKPLLKCHDCDEIVDAAIARLLAARDAGWKSGVARRRKSVPKNNENNDLRGTKARTGVKATVGTGAAAINSSLHNLPLEDCGESDDHISKLRRLLKIPCKEWFWKGAEVDELARTVTFPARVYHSYATSNYGRELSEANLIATSRDEHA